MNFWNSHDIERIWNHICFVSAEKPSFSLNQRQTEIQINNKYFSNKKKKETCFFLDFERQWDEKN